MMNAIARFNLRTRGRRFICTETGEVGTMTEWAHALVLAQGCTLKAARSGVYRRNYGGLHFEPACERPGACKLAIAHTGPCSC
jgi:hypothetical protein